MTTTGCKRDANGHLRHWDEWSEAVAEEMAAEEGIALSATHWQIIRLLRAQYAELKVTPPMRLLIKTIAAELGTETGNSRALYRLFPDSPLRQGTKIAGLPKPASCI